MPTTIKKVNGYQVRTPGEVKAKSTTLRKAKSQSRLLRAVDHGFKPTGKPAQGNPGPLQRIAQNQSVGGGSRGACGGTRRFDGSGGGTGNVGTNRQPGKNIVNRLKKM